ncbi:MAG: hypothetical protein ACHREM_24345 [Polyangiales bacterium]
MNQDTSNMSGAARARSSRAPSWIVTLASGAMLVGCAGVAPDRDSMGVDAGGTDTGMQQLTDKIVCTGCTLQECELVEVGGGKQKLICTCNPGCPGSTTCVANKCVAAGSAPGAACTSTAACQSGLTCIDAVCCQSPSCGPCATCAASGNGTCTNLAAGTTPTHACIGGTTACPDSLCDGFHSTCMPPNGEPCTVTGCDTATGSNSLYFTGAGVCAVDGSCHGTAATCPGLFACESGACKTSCLTSADCATGATCNKTKHHCQ